MAIGAAALVKGMVNMTERFETIRETKTKASVIVPAEELVTMTYEIVETRINKYHVKNKGQSVGQLLDELIHDCAADNLKLGKMTIDLTAFNTFNEE